MKRRWFLGLLTLTIIAACLALPVWWKSHQKHQARLAWKESAIPEINRYADDSAWVRREIFTLTNESATEENQIIEEPWLSDRMMLMNSGEWLVYRSHCHKEEPRNVEDICIAKASNGRWYYTTCHFCVRMLALTMLQHEPPPDLGSFLKRYQFREFDGHSNECLKTTKTFPDNP